MENKNQNQKELLKQFVSSLITQKENSLIRQKDNSIKPILFNFTPFEIGLNSDVVEIVKVSIKRQQINKIICSLLNVEISLYNDVVLKEVEKNELYTEYNKEVKKLLKDNINVVLQTINKK